MTDTAKKEKEGAFPAGDEAAITASGKKTQVKTQTATAVEKEEVPKGEKGEPGTKGPWMYVGPTIPGIGIQNRVYKEIPKEAAQRAKEVPEVNLLFLPVKDYPMANKMLRERTGYLYDAYCKAASLRKGGGKA